MNMTEKQAGLTIRPQTERRRRWHQRREFDRAVALDLSFDARLFPPDPAEYRLVHCCTWNKENSN